MDEWRCRSSAWQRQLEYSEIRTALLGVHNQRRKFKENERMIALSCKNGDTNFSFIKKLGLLNFYRKFIIYNLATSYTCNFNGILLSLLIASEYQGYVNTIIRSILFLNSNYCNTWLFVFYCVSIFQN